MKSKAEPVCIRHTGFAFLCAVNYNILKENSKETNHMDLFDAIRTRKSCRKYTPQPVDEKVLEEIRSAVETFRPLYPDVPLDFRFVPETKGLYKVEAPQYLIISGQGKQGEMENAGFLFQQLVLWFDVHELGSVWLGKTRDVNPNPNGTDLIAIAFGQTDGPVHRVESEFKRKPIEEITNDPQDPCIQAVHLAPSGMNLQPWYLEKDGDRILLYIQKLKSPLALAYKLTDLDMGIALCHYALACERLGKTFTFERRDEDTDKKGYRLFGILS